MRWVYTAMHGVGWETLSRTLEAAGYPAPQPVTEQLEPDGAFPTVAFPNPEEPGAMDLSFEAARAADAEFVIANDPDADRLAVAVPDPDAEGGWRRLSGNQIGLLLGWRGAKRAAELGAADGASLACSLVSSPGLEAVADALRPRLPRDAHRVQVDLARTRPGVRVRGGPRLSREPRDRARQGRHLGRDRDAGNGRRGPGPRREHRRPHRGVRRDVRPLRERPDRDPGRRRVDDHADHGGTARAASVGHRRRRASSGSTTCSTASTASRPETSCGCGSTTGRA